MPRRLQQESAKLVTCGRPAATAQPEDANGWKFDRHFNAQPPRQADVFKVTADRLRDEADRSAPDETERHEE